jgi:prepilin-type N-terminal cleavage/methylation domain-containing protein
MKRRNAFTLIEVLITMALFALLMTLVSSAIINTLRFHRQGVEMARLKEKASGIMNAITAEIISANTVLTTIFNNPSPTLAVIKTDLHHSDSDPHAGGDLTVIYSHHSPGVIKRNGVVIADNIKSLQFVSHDSAQWMITIDITVVQDINDPHSPIYSLSTSICRRGTMPLWEFGP